MCLSTEPAAPPKVNLIPSTTGTAAPDRISNVLPDPESFKPGDKVVAVNIQGSAGLRQNEILTVHEVFPRQGALTVKETSAGLYKINRFRALLSEKNAVRAGEGGVIPQYLLKRLDASGAKVFAKIYEYRLGIEADAVYGVRSINTQTGTIQLTGKSSEFTLEHVHPVYAVGDIVEVTKGFRGIDEGTKGVVKSVHLDGIHSEAVVEIPGRPPARAYLSFFRLADNAPAPVAPEAPVVQAETFPPVTAAQVSMGKLARNPFNSGRTFTFVRGNDPVINRPGWQVQEIPGFHPVPAIMVPHDLIEHEPRSPSTPEEEFKAVGAALYLRGETEFFSANGLGDFIPAMIAGAMEPLFFHILNGNTPTSPYQTVRSAAQPLKNAKSEMTLIAFAAKTVENLSRKYDQDPAKVAVIQATMANFLGWARIGYRRAQKRFQNVDRKRLNASYVQIWKLAEQYLNIAQDGDVLTITWLPESYTATVTLNATNKLTA